MNGTIEVAAVMLSQRLVVLPDGAQLPITNFFGAGGEEVEGPDGALSAVAGPLPDGCWVSVDLSSFRRATVH